MAINIRVELIHVASSHTDVKLKTRRDQETLKECSDFMLFDEQNVKLTYLFFFTI